MSDTPAPVTDEFLVHTITDGFQLRPTVAALAGGGFVVTWESTSTAIPGGNGPDIHVRLFDAAGNPLGGEFRANTFTANLQIHPAVAALDDGGFVVTWSSGGQDSDPNFGIYGQRFDSTGAPVGSEFHIDAEPPPFNTDNGHAGAGLAEITTTGTDGDDTATGSATAVNRMDGGAGRRADRTIR